MTTMPRETAEAIHACRSLSPEDCANSARERFDLRKTIAKYFELYENLIDSSPTHGDPKGAEWAPCPN